MQEIVKEKPELANEAGGDAISASDVLDIVNKTLQLLPETKRVYWRGRIRNCKTDVAKLEICKRLVRKIVRWQRKNNHEART